jgi:hypothetical protein
MGQLTDQLRGKAYRSVSRRPLPEWWPAAQVAAAVVFGVGMLFFVLRDEPATSSITASAPVNTADVITGPSGSSPDTAVTPVDTSTDPDAAPEDTTDSIDPAPEDTTDTGPNDTNVNDAVYKTLPGTLDAQTLSIEFVDGGQKAIPLNVWMAVRDYAGITFANSSLSGAALQSNSQVAYTIILSLTGAQGSYNVQVTAVQQSNGTWAAS